MDDDDELDSLVPLDAAVLVVLFGRFPRRSDFARAGVSTSAVVFTDLAAFLLSK